jgi:hypothetical protein
MRWGRIWTVNTTHYSGQLGLTPLNLIIVPKVSDKTGFFLYKYLVTGEDDRAVFLIPSDILTNTIITSAVSTNTATVTAMAEGQHLFQGMVQYSE